MQAAYWLRRQSRGTRETVSIHLGSIALPPAVARWKQLRSLDRVEMTDGMSKRGEEMEKRFESELGKRIAEGSRRGEGRKAAAVAVAVISAVAFIGTAAFSLMTSAQYAPYMTDEMPFDHLQSTIDDEDGSVEVSRVMTLMTRAYDIDTGGGAHVDCFKFIYVMNVAVVGSDGVLAEGAPIGALNLSFSDQVAVYYKWSIEATVYEAEAGTSTTYSYDTLYDADESAVDFVTVASTDVTVGDVTTTDYTVSVVAPDGISGSGDTMRFYFTMTFYYVTNLDGTAYETPFSATVPFKAEF